MTMRQKVIALILALLLVMAGIAYWETAPLTAKALRHNVAERAAAELVDDTTYASAQRLNALPATPEELPFAQSALRVSDHELDLAFSAALSEVDAHPPKLNDAASRIQERIKKSQSMLDGDQQRVKQVTQEQSQAPASQKDALQDELDLAQSQLELDKDELEEANQDLVDAGGNPRQRIETMVQEHAAQTKAQSPPPDVAQSAIPSAGSVGRFRGWWRIHQKRNQLSAAQDEADQHADTLTQRRAELAATLDRTKGSISELSQHTKTAKDAGSAAPPVAPPPVQHSHSDAATLLGQTRGIAADQKLLTTIDRRITDQRELAAVYSAWSTQLATQARVFVHALCLQAIIVVLTLLLLMLMDKWLSRLLDRPKLDRRQVETLRSMARIAVRVVGVVVILVILVGLPNQFGTMIGFVGAGLTVALKDFIVAFFGWLVLMGRNGIRLGDWVEINGVSGEVIELGMFHTVLLETGNWGDAGHPTGRRVTFTNSFAIERHYFNFSTSGQWLWDELQIVVPSGRDPYPIVDGIMKKVGEVTAESSRLAEQEWNRSIAASRGKTFTITPGVNLKPVYGGIEIAIRYITRANERSTVRAKLYQLAVELLGQEARLVPPPG
jgi:small-conductance mechanosensitive channel